MVTSARHRSGAQPGQTKRSLALQLWSLHDQLEHNTNNTLNWIAKRGFSKVEVAGFAGLGARRFAGLLSERGLRVVGLHGPDIGQFLSDEEYVGWAVEYTTLFNTDTVTLFRSLGSLGSEPSDRTGSDAQELADSYYVQLAPRLRAICDALAQHNPAKRLCYHCYPSDLVCRKGNAGETRCGLEILLNLVERGNFGIQLDMYWLVCSASLSLEAVLEIVKDRVKSVHVNDIDSEFRPVAIGSGQINWKNAVHALLEKNPQVEWILEHGAQFMAGVGPSVNARDLIVKSQEMWDRHYESWKSGDQYDRR